MLTNELRARVHADALCVCRPEEPGHVHAGGALVSGSGEETLRGEQEEAGGEAEGVRLRGAHEGAAGGGEEEATSAWRQRRIRPQ